MIPFTLVFALFAYGLLTAMCALWLITITSLVKYEGYSAFTATIGLLGGIVTLFSCTGLAITLQRLASAI